MCREYAQMVADEARSILSDLERTGGLHRGIRRGVAFQLACQNVLKLLRKEQRDELIELADKIGLYVDLEFWGDFDFLDLVILQALKYCSDLRPRIAI